MKKIFQISIFLFSSFVQNFGSNFFENLTRDYLDLIDKTAYNINTKTIQYSLTYQKSILKVLIKTEEKITKEPTPSDLGYWCAEGGTHHVAGDGANEHGYYSSWNEAQNAFENYTKGWPSVQYKISQCLCGKYYFWAIQ